VKIPLKRRIILQKKEGYEYRVIQLPIFYYLQYRGSSILDKLTRFYSVDGGWTNVDSTSDSEIANKWRKFYNCP
jgi:hypothetical protein